MKKSIGLLLAAAIAAPAAPAAATAVAGASAILTNRTCGGPANVGCTLGPRIFTQYAGGMGGGFTTSADNMNGLGAAASAAVSFGDGYLPTIKVGSAAGTTTRTGGNANAFRSYTNTGDRAIELALNGQLHFITSGDVVPGDAFGEGSMNVLLSLIPLAMLDQFNPNSSGQDLVNSNIGFADCSGGAIASTGFATSPGTAPGEYTVNLNLAQTCGGFAITINPGESFVVLATMQAISSRTGFLDATHTFSVLYDLENTVFADTGEAVGASYLNQAVSSDVPEPAMLGLFGLGALALGARRRTL